jgi:predicted AAA+ superfamily ATPase
MQTGNIKFGEKMYLFFDEVTHQTNFEIQLKNLFDLYQSKIYISSSSATLLKSKKPFLTGRNALMEIQPLDFNEYLQFKRIEISQADKHLVPLHFNNYMITGGIPEYVLRGDISYITELIDDIIFKDIAAHHQIRQPQILKEYFLLLMERAGKQLSINKIAAILKITPDTSRRYLEMFADTFLIHLMGRFGKTNETLLSARKVYAADLGLRCAYTGIRDFGSLFENYIYLKLKHLNPKYLYQNGTEIDFITENKWVVESKYHDEPLSDKQQKMFDLLLYEKKTIVRSFADLEMIDFDY